MSLIVASSLVGKPIARAIAKKFGGAIIERWTRYRADRFFEAFVETLGMEFSTGLKLTRLTGA
jgi:hypothetical protein